MSIRGVRGEGPVAVDDEIERANTNAEFISPSKYPAKKMPPAIWKVRKRSIGRSGYAVGDAQRRGRRIGGGSGVSLRQNAISAVISSPTDGCPVVRADQATPSMVQPAGIK